METESSTEMVSPPKETSTITLKKVGNHIQLDSEDFWFELPDGTLICVYRGYEDVAKISIWYSERAEIALYGKADRRVKSRRFNNRKSKVFHLEKVE